jgi:hypothetical protein
MWAVGEGGFKLNLFGLNKFPKFRRSAKVHMNAKGYTKEKQHKHI